MLIVPVPEMAAAAMVAALIICGGLLVLLIIALVLYWAASSAAEHEWRESERAWQRSGGGALSTIRESGRHRH